MKTDIDRLHNYVLNKPVGRGVGKTFAQCQEIAGWIGVGEKEIIAVLEYYEDVKHIAPMLISILKEQDFNVSYNRNHGFIKADDAKVLFKTNRNNSQNLRGYDNDSMIYMYR